jgi:hypothetical protein
MWAEPYRACGALYSLGSLPLDLMLYDLRTRIIRIKDDHVYQ